MTQVTQIPLAAESEDESPKTGTNKSGHAPDHHVLGTWTGDHSTLVEDDSAIHSAICDLIKPIFVIQDQN